jgi:predicted transcriptional regulator with HTH domain
VKASEELNNLVLEQIVEQAKQKLPAVMREISYGLWRAKIGDLFYLGNQKDILLKIGVIKEVDNSEYKYKLTDKGKEICQLLEAENYFKFQF